jgi:hypothetical protein
MSSFVAFFISFMLEWGKSSAGVAGERPKDQTRLRIEKMEAEREERRRAMVEVRHFNLRRDFCSWTHFYALDIIA